MRNKLLKISPVISLLLLTPLIAGALPATEPPPGVTTTIQLFGGRFLGLANWFVNWFFAIVLLLSLLALIYGAFIFITAGGDTTKTTQARQWLLWALIGFAVAILVRTLLTIVCTFFLGAGACPWIGAI